MCALGDKTLSHSEKDKVPTPCSVDVVLLTNFVAPYRLELFRSLRRSLKELHIFVSIGMDPGRPWPVCWKGLNVTAQRSISWRRTWKHPQGFSESINCHIPWDTIQLLRQHRPQVVISAELGARSILSAFYCWMNPTTRHVIWATLSQRTEEGRGFLRFLLRRWLLRRADAVLVNGRSGERYVRSLNAREQRILLAPQATDMSSLLSFPLHRDARTRRKLLFVGQLVERKGLESFLAALARWGSVNPRRRVELVIVGDGPLKNRLKAISLPQNVCVSWVGAVGYEETHAFYCEAGILVFPSLADEWGLVTNEAMAAGLPVLGSVYSQAVEELVEDGRTGWKFVPDDPVDVDRALQQALSTPSPALEAMGARARCRIGELTPDAVAQEILKAVRLVSTSPVK